jgi:hypothetical protein
MLPHTRRFDGHFQAGRLAGRSVNVKWYLRQESVLDMTASSTLDYYLVMTGPWLSSALGRNTSPWLIDYVYFFDAQQLPAEKQRHGVKIGFATSVQK